MLSNSEAEFLSKTLFLHRMLGGPLGGYTYRDQLEGGMPKRFTLWDPNKPDGLKVTYILDMDSPSGSFWRRIATRPDGTSYENAIQDSGLLAAVLYSIAKGHTFVCEDIIPEEPDEDEEEAPLPS